MSPPAAFAPEWLEEFSTRLATSSQIVLAGAVNEQHYLDIAGIRGWRSTAQVVRDTLEGAGYSPVQRWMYGTGLTGTQSTWSRSADGTDLHGAIQALLVPRREADPGPEALIVTGVERLAENYSVSPLRDILALAQAGARGTQPVPGLPQPNLTVWLVDRTHDLPPWFLATRGVQTLLIPLPSRQERHEIGRNLLTYFTAFDKLDDQRKAGKINQIADLCEGMTRGQMREVGTFARSQALSPAHVEDAVRGTRSGLSHSPWNDPGLGRNLSRAREILIDGDAPRLEESIQRVVGQPAAVEHALAVLERAHLGLSDWDEVVHSARPRGVLFFAGPTGVGKTFLAKQLASVLFGREEAMERFDMSEYANDGSEARFIGAPPGYIGYAAGGQLTNRVRERPFSLLLFDEIDKAHPLILDKFLQILEDGRLTDGTGSTVHFGETLIIFTSNLGIQERGSSGSTGSAGGKMLVTPGTPYEKVNRLVRDEVERYFHYEIQRPEILNRIGENVLVFDFLTEAVAVDLLHQKLDRLERTLEERVGVQLTVTTAARSDLERLITQRRHLANGGRGVKNVIEAHLVNPLTRVLRDPRPRRVTVTRVVGDDVQVVTS